ncbi:hypothetical protein HS041_37660 [Planomonospora sp. ID67723]|uniref:hypothetical protein n=1 Tax=Planomonospora sp. ID67723 TaxID=2738134 RepID=UPI0018C3D53D|nr:hypothetical protein [Planomonospora sp. ID67723]MBG0833431.1 hypothetical protein [Planomonospora sp. ID67723]
MASGPHDPRSREWPPDDDGVPDDTEHPSRSQEPHQSPPTIQHTPPGPSDDRPRGLPLSSPWVSPPFAAPSPDDADPPRPSGERRRPYSQPYGTRPPAPAEPPAEPPAAPGGTASADGPPAAESSAGLPAASPAGSSEPPETAAGPGPRRRRADRPDLLVASGPPREPRARVSRGEPRGEGGSPTGPAREPARPADSELVWPVRKPEPVPGPPAAPAPAPGEPEEPREEGRTPPAPPPHEQDDPPAPHGQDEPHPHEQDDFEPVRRVGRPPGGRPARPDLLVAQGPPRKRGPNGGRHHRSATAPSAVRRSSPARSRRGRGLVIPFLMVLVLTAAVGGGLVLWGWMSSPFATGLSLVGDDFRLGDETFVSPTAGHGDGANQVLNDVVSVGSTTVAVGSDTTSPVPRPLFLVSSDGGATWRLGEVAGPVGREGAPTTVGLVAGGDGRWLAAGNEPFSTAPGLWTSVDGRSWRAENPAGLTAFGTGGQIMDLARTSSGFVAVGATFLDDGTYGAAAWTSADGRAWTRVEARDLGPSVRGLQAVAARGDAVVALADPADEDSGAVVLRSGDGGRSWLRAGKVLDGVTPRTGSLAAAGKGFVLVPTQQRDARGEVRAYCSANGGTWDPCGAITGLDPQGSGVKRLASSSAGVAAVAESGPERYAVYTSKDGRDWARTTELGEVSGTLRALAISDEGMLVAGGDRRAVGEDNRLVLITAPPGGEARPVALDAIAGLNRVARETARVAAGDGVFVAVGTASGDAGIWTSADGEEWRAGGPAQIFGGRYRQALDDVAHGRRGWLAVGGAMNGVASTEPLLVTSADGQNWRRVPVMGSLAPGDGRTFLAAHAVAAGRSGYVLAGEERDLASATPVLWFSSDLKRYTRAGRLPSGGAGVRLHDVSPTSSGYMAVGGSGTAGRETGVVWVSADGVNWSAREPVLPAGASAAILRHVVTYGGQVVVAGGAETEDGPRAFAAVSRDNGATWRTTWLPADRAAAVQDLAATQEGVVAVGWQGEPGEGDSAAWTSEDGLSWQRHTPTRGRLAGEGAQGLGAVAVSGDRVVALGRSTTYDADHLILWRSTLAAGR